MAYNERKKLIAGYDTLIREIIENETAEAYFVNFMFNHLPGGKESRKEQMWIEVTRFHRLLTRHVVRKPESKNWSHLRPVLIGVPDMPVRKLQKTSIRNFQVNDGLHFNATVLLPPRCRFEGRSQHPWFRKQSRLSVSLRKLVKENQRLFLTEKLDRIHITAIKEGTMADYAFKTLKSGYADEDDILVLN
jgi:hypothetical protein